MQLQHPWVGVSSCSILRPPLLWPLAWSPDLGLDWRRLMGHFSSSCFFSRPPSVSLTKNIPRLFGVQQTERRMCCFSCLSCDKHLANQDPKYLTWISIHKSFQIFLSQSFVFIREIFDRGSRTGFLVFLFLFLFWGPLPNFQQKWHVLVNADQFFIKSLKACLN